MRVMFPAPGGRTWVLFADGPVVAPDERAPSVYLQHVIDADVRSRNPFWVERAKEIQIEMEGATASVGAESGASKGWL